MVRTTTALEEPRDSTPAGVQRRAARPTRPGRRRSSPRPARCDPARRRGWPGATSARWPGRRLQRSSRRATRAGARPARRAVEQRRTDDLSGKSDSTRISCERRVPLIDTEIHRPSAPCRAAREPEQIQPAVGGAARVAGTQLDAARPVATRNRPGRTEVLRLQRCMTRQRGECPETTAARSTRPASGTPKARRWERDRGGSLSSSTSPARPSAPLATRCVAPRVTSASARDNRAPWRQPPRGPRGQSPNRLFAMSSHHYARGPFAQVSLAVNVAFNSPRHLPPNTPAGSSRSMRP